MVRSLLAGSDYDASMLRRAGVSLPGLVDTTTGYCRLAPNLGWRDVNLGELVGKALGIPVTVGNITAAAALAEGRLGAAQEVRSFVWVYAGTGIGAAVIDDGELFTGAHRYAGEIGHCPVPGNDELCNCGNRGCLETVAGAPAIVRAATAAVKRRPATALRRHRGSLDADTVAQVAADGDAVARAILDEAGAHLGRGIAHILNLFGPEMVVVGGPLARGGERYLAAALATARRHTLEAQAVPIVPSTLGPQVNLLGAVQLAVDADARSYRIVGATS
jgi:predicted NBD/HSP70 family sugar kinase